MIETGILKQRPDFELCTTKLTDFGDLWAFLLGKEDDNQTISSQLKVYQLGVLAGSELRADGKLLAKL